jgi:hypothetical protein
MAADLARWRWKLVAAGARKLADAGRRMSSPNI